MANKHHLSILDQGVKIWNEWRQANPGIQPDLRGASLSSRDLTEINLSGAILSEAKLQWATLMKANLGAAILQKADLTRAVFLRANLSGVDLSEARLQRAILTETNLSKATLTGAFLESAELNIADCSDADFRDANLGWANLSGTDLRGADLTGCRIYATAAWDVKLEGAKQSNLIITNPYETDQPTITVDNLDVAQFMYLLLNNERLQSVIKTITTKVVLIKGRVKPRALALGI